jgi:hypothetical protein
MIAAEATVDAGDAGAADEPLPEGPEFSTALADAAYSYAERTERTLRHLIRFADAGGFLNAG